MVGVSATDDALCIQVDGLGRDAYVARAQWLAALGFGIPAGLVFFLMFLRWGFRKMR